MTSCLHDGCQDCNKETGQCITCKHGKYGEEDCSLDCSRFCSKNGNEEIICNKISGSCDTGSCIAGHWSEDCTNECSEYCSTDTCDLNTGVCTPCITGWYGQSCLFECSARCKDKDCVTEATQCRNGCADGYWGGSCEFSCNTNCNLKACNKDTGSCMYGCTNSQYWNAICDKTCNSNCVGGVCNMTGYCQQGCNIGYYSDQCQITCLNSSKCIDGTCNRLDGSCPDCFTSTPGSNCPTAGKQTTFKCFSN